MDLIQFNQEAMEEEMSLIPAFSIWPSQSIDSLYYRAKMVYHLTTHEDVLQFSTCYLN